MSLGSVLIKPQPVATPLPPQVDPADIIVDFFEAFTRNPEGAAAAAEVLARVVPEVLGDFVRSFEEKIRLSDGRIRQLFRPFGAGIDAFLAGLEKDTVVDVLAGTLEMVAAILAQLTKARVTAFIRSFAGIVAKDLGVSEQTLRNLVTTLATRVITELKQNVINGETSRTAVARYEFGAALDGVRSLFDEEEIEVPKLDLEILIDVVAKLWDQGRIDRLLAWIQDLLAHRDDLLAPLAAVIEARLALRAQISVSVTPAPVGAGATGATIEADPPAAAPAPNEKPPIAWYATWVAGETRRYPKELSHGPNTFENHELVGFTYKHVSREAMEKMAFHSAWAMPVVEGLILHASSLEQGDVLSNLHIIALDAIDFGLVLGDKGPIPSWWHWTAKPLMTMFLWGFESGWDRVGASNDPYVWTNAAGDMGEVLLYWRWSRLSRELLLSFFTLLNNNPDEFKTKLRDAATDAERSELHQSRNCDCFEGICYTFWEFGAMFIPIITSRTSRKDYGFIGGAPSPLFWGLAFGGFFTAAAFGYLSIFLARLLAGEFFDDKARYGLLLGRSRLYGPYRFQADFSSFSEGADSIGGWLGTPLGFGFMLAASIGDSPIYAYLFTDGSTDDGTYWVDLAGIERTLPGYPPAAGSPYLLPWAGGTVQQCVQGNMGVWSHYPQNGSQAQPFNNGQMYAYDYSHDVGTEVLCSRAGIVTMACDVFPDNNPSNWNSTEILHLILNPATGGLAAVPPPAGVTTFADGVTPIPAGTLFPPWWTAGTPLPGLPNPMPLHPSAAILPGATATAPGALPGSPPAYYAPFTGFPAGTTFAFLDPAVDRAIPGITMPAGVTFSDGTPIPAGSVFAPGTVAPPAPGTASPAGTSFIPPGAGGGNWTPLRFTFCVYGHLMNGFMQISTAPASPAVPGITQTPRPTGRIDVFRSRRQNITLGDNNTPALIPAAQRTFTTTGPFPAAVTGAALANNNVFLNSINTSDVLGLFVQQGQPVGLSGDTGVSAYNHLHSMVYGVATLVGSTPTLPFAYADATHGIKHGLREGLRSNGVPRSFTFYESGNTRVAPT